MTQQQTPPANKTPLIVMSALGLLVMAVLAWVFTRPQSGPMVTEFYKYYPQSTALYMEVAPGDKLALDIVKGVERLKHFEPGQIGHHSVDIAAVFQKDFEPRLSFGLWKPTGTDSAEATGNGSFLMVLPLKSGVTLETLATDLKTDPGSYTLKKDGAVTMMVNKDPRHPVLATNGSLLLTADKEATLTQALEAHKSGKSVLDNPLFKTHLGLLPAKRQGSVLALAGELQALAQSRDAGNSEFEKLNELQKQMQAATPVTVASIEITNDQLVHFNAFTPIDAGKITNEALRKDMVAIYQNQASFDLARQLPKETLLYGGAAGLSRYYDLYMNHIASASEKESVTTATNQLKMMGLDLRKNIVSLFDAKAAVGLIAKPGQPDFVVFLHGSPETQKTMDQFGMMAAQFSQGTLTDKKVDAQHALKVLESKNLPLKVGFSNPQPDTLVVGTEAGLEKMYGASQKKIPSLADNALYTELSSVIPAKASGVFFMDVSQSTEAMEKWTGSATAPGKPSLKELLGGVQGVAGANTLEGDKMIRSHVMLKLNTTQTATTEASSATP